jgi:hypothetical protein
MGNQSILKADGTLVEPPVLDIPTINLPEDFKLQSVDEKLKPKPVTGGFRAIETEKAGATAATLQDEGPNPLGVLAHFEGKTFVGTGFNTIFRPSGPQNRAFSAKNPELAETEMPNPVVVTGAPDDNVLQLNLTTETLAFSKSLGSIPNRGLPPQTDLALHGVPYVQTIKAVTNVKTGKADGEAKDIHFEPGIWINVPATDAPKVDGTLCRMASIPHGTTINAQGKAPATVTQGPPDIASHPAPITPTFVTPAGAPPGGQFRFPSQDIGGTNGARLPQDLTKFNDAGTITQKILDNPNEVLININASKKITKTITFIVDTDFENDSTGPGISNIEFLDGFNGSGRNARASKMKAIFWIETVENTIEIPACKPGQPDLFLRPIDLPQGQTHPIFVFKPEHEIKTPKKITVTSEHIQYSQTVILEFNGLNWPHVSVATLVPYAPQPVPASAVEG